MNTPRMRTITEAYAELKRLDPETAFTLSALKRAVKKGELPALMVGNKRLINLDTMLEMLGSPSVEAKAKTDKTGTVRPLI